MKPTAWQSALRRICAALLVWSAAVAVPSARGGSFGWLDEVVQQAVREANVGSRAAVRGEARAARTTGKLLIGEAETSLEALARRSDSVARLAKPVDEPAEALLRARFQRVVGPDASMARTFDSLRPAEKRLVVEMGEAAQIIARRYPGQAEAMIRKLGVEGLSAVRACGDDVGEVVVKEGPATVNVLRKTGRSGWSFFTEKVLPHKGKLVAAGVFAAFMANPQQFVDTAGHATQYAVEQFARAGIALTGAVGGGAARGLDTAVGSALASVGLDHPVSRWVILGGATLAALGALLVLIGTPIRWLMAPVLVPLRFLRRGPRSAA